MSGAESESEFEDEPDEPDSKTDALLGGNEQERVIAAADKASAAQPTGFTFDTAKVRF